MIDSYHESPLTIMRHHEPWLQSCFQPAMFHCQRLRLKMPLVILLIWVHHECPTTNSSHCYATGPNYWDSWSCLARWARHKSCHWVANGPPPRAFLNGFNADSNANTWARSPVKFTCVGDNGWFPNQRLRFETITAITSHNMGNIHPAKHRSAPVQ